MRCWRRGGDRGSLCAAEWHLRSRPCFATDRHFLGAVDEAAIWNRALTEQEIAGILELSRAGESYCRLAE